MNKGSTITNKRIFKKNIFGCTHRVVLHWKPLPIFTPVAKSKSPETRETMPTNIKRVPGIRAHLSEKSDSELQKCTPSGSISFIASSVRIVSIRLKPIRRNFFCFKFI